MRLPQSRRLQPLRARILLADEQIIGLRMTHPPATSLRQFAKDSVAIAKRIMIDPQLFAIKMELKTNFLKPKSFAPAPTIAYATPENSAQYLELINTDHDDAVVPELAPFIPPKTSCLGGHTSASKILARATAGGGRSSGFTKLEDRYSQRYLEDYQ